MHRPIRLPQHREPSLLVAIVITEVSWANKFAASIENVIDCGDKLHLQVKEFRSSIVEAPKTFRDILVRLPLILDTFKQIRQELLSEAIDRRTQNAFEPFLGNIYDEISRLREIVGSVMPGKNDSPLMRAKKALQSVRYENDARTIFSKLLDSVKTLTCHRAAVQGSFRGQPTTVNCFNPADKTFYRFRLDQALADLNLEDKLTAETHLALSLRGNVDVEKLLREVINGYRDNEGRGSYYPIALDSLGICLLNQGKREEALKFHQMALEAKEKSLGPDHPSTLLTVMNLRAAKMNSSATKALFDGDEVPSRILLARKEQALGPEHPDTLLSVTVLSRSLMRDEPSAEAETLALRALAGNERVLGADHLQTIIAMDTVAYVWSVKGQLEKAKGYYERALKGYDKILGPDDDRTKSCWWSYLTMPPECRGLGRIPSREFAVNHPASIFRLYCEGRAQYKKGDYQHAQELQRKALALFESQWGPEKRDTLTCAHDLGLTLIELWQYNEAEVLFRRILALRKKLLDHDHRDVLGTMNALGVTLWNLRGSNIIEAEQLFRDILATRERLGQTENASFLATRSNLGLIEFHRKDYAAALKTYRAVLIDRERIQGPEHSDTTLCILSISMALTYEGEYEEARRLNEKALRGLIVNPGSDHPDFLHAQAHLAKVLQALGRFEDAEDTIRAVIAGRERVLGPYHGSTFKSRSRLVSILEMQERFDEALHMSERIYEEAVMKLGEDNLETHGHKLGLDGLKHRMNSRVYFDDDSEENSDYDRYHDHSEYSEESA